MELIENFIREEDGVTAIEYGLIAALIAVVIMVTVGNIGTNLNRLFGLINTKLSSITGA